MMTQQKNNCLLDEALPKIAVSTEVRHQRYVFNITALYSAQSDSSSYRKSYIAWDNIERANKPKNCTDKKQVLSKNSQAILAVIMQKLRSKDKVFFNHKYISTITRCKRRQNQNIIKELSDILEINYHNSVSDSNGQKYRYCYSFSSKKLEQNDIADYNNFDSSIGQFFARRYYIEENNIINNRSNALMRESNFDNDLNLEDISKTNEIIFSEESKKASVCILKQKRPSNKRKKRTNAEVKARKAKVFVFKQYSDKKDLAAHYPLNSEDCSKLQVLSGRDFTLNAMNEILLDMSKRVGRLFSSRAQFIAYMAKVYENEKRDSVQTSNIYFKIKTNQSDETREDLECEKFLSKIEQQAIDHVCPENQLKAKLAGTLALKTAYNFLLKSKNFKLVGRVAKIYLTSPMSLKSTEKDIILSQVRAVYGDVDDLEFITDGAGEGCFVVLDIHNHEPKSLNLPQGVWGEISQKLIDKYGRDIYKSWFSRVTPCVSDVEKTISLFFSSSMVYDWITCKYGSFIKKVAQDMNFGIKYLEKE